MDSFVVGRKLGSGAGKVAAKLVHVTIVAAQGAGRFGEGVMAGAEDGYATQAKLDSANRVARAAAFELQMKQRDAERQHPLTMAVSA